MILDSYESWVSRIESRIEFREKDREQKFTPDWFLGNFTLTPSNTGAARADSLLEM